MPEIWVKCGKNAPKMNLKDGKNVAKMWQKCGKNVPKMCLKYGKNVAKMKLKIVLKYAE